jgi:PAS domain S-box-containing protein
VAFELTVYSLPALAGGLCALGIALYSWTRHTRLGSLLALFALCAAVWGLAYTLEVNSATLAGKLLWAKLAYLGIAGAPVAWLAFALQFTGRDQVLNHRVLTALLIIPLITLLLVFSNDLHGLVWSQTEISTSGPFAALAVVHGAWFWIFTVYGYVLNLLGIVLVLLAMVRAPAVYQGQAAMLLLGVAVPWLGNFVFLTGQSSLPDWDLTPAGFILSAVALAWGAWRYQLLELQPVPRDTLVDASADGLIVLDSLGRVVDLNSAAHTIVGAQVAIGQSVRTVLPDQPELLNGGAAPTRTEVRLGQPPRAYDLSVTPLKNSTGEQTGQLIALRDISAQKEAEAALREQKQLFENLVAVARATAERPSMEATLQNALNVAAALTGAERGSLFLLNPVGLVTNSLLTYRGMTPDQQQTVVRRVMDRGLAGWVVRQRSAALIVDTTQDERWLAPSSEASPVGSALGVPILSGSALVGVLTLSHAQTHRFTEEHLHLMQAAADQLALALRNAQMYEEQRLMARRQAALYGVMREVGEQLNPQDVAEAAVDAIVRLVGDEARWPGVGIALPERESHNWVQAAGVGPLAHPVGQRYSLDEGVIGRAFVTGQTQTGAHVPASPDDRGPGAALSELAVPMRRGTRVLGVLNLESTRLEAFDADDAQLAESLADAVALVLDNVLLYQEIAGESSRLQALIGASRDGILLLSRDLRLLVVNARVLALLGLPGTPEDWLGRTLVRLLLDLRHRAPQLVKAALAEAHRVRGDEAAHEAEGEVPPRTLAWLNLPVTSGALPLGRLVVLRDVTEERDVQKLRDNLTHTMVHDLRNPLTNIRMALELLNQAGMTNGGGAGSDAQQREVLQIALNSTQRMLGLVNAILDVNRLESGQMPLVREPVPLRDATTEVFLMQMPQAVEKHLRLENQVPDNLPMPNADAGLIRRVVQNLVGNAIKFTPEGGLVRVSGRLEADGAHVLVTVADTGPGLPPEIRANLFQKFVTGRHRERGSGLGLAYCRLAIETHGGKIWAVSEPGWGAVFSFTLPLET